MTDSVRHQIRDRYSALMRTSQTPDVAALELSAAHGEMGKLLLAAGCFEAAEPYFRHAQALAPTDYRWPYYLGHLFKIGGAFQQSAESFEQVLTLKVDDVTTLLRLGDLYLAEGRLDLAEPLFGKTLALQPRSVAALFGLGRAALAKQDYAAAVRHFEQSLQADPRAAAVHYPLAIAYRELGDQTKAELHLRQRREANVPVPDPLLRELDDLLQSPAAYESRGIRALDTGDWTAAAAHFRKGLELAPADPSLGHRLGTALFMMGDAQAALQQFERVLSESPGFARAHYSLGVLMETSGRPAEAIQRFSGAVRYEPTYIEARLRLASVLGRTGHLRDALAQYEQVLDIDPRIAGAQYGRALALVRLRRYQEARGALSEGMKTYADQPSFALALARVLAAAPDDRIRDGRGAMAVVQGLPAEQRAADSGETMAMIFAELGQYDEAEAWQRRAIDGAKRAGRNDVAARMIENLRLYESGRPCRTPWREDEMP